MSSQGLKKDLPGASLSSAPICLDLESTIMNFLHKLTKCL